jgi:hypothetical protein
MRKDEFMCPPGLAGDVPPALFPGDAGAGGLTEDCQSQVSEGTEVVWCVAAFGAVGVFLHAHIFLAMEEILYLPVITNRLSRRCWRQLVCAGCGEGVNDLVGLDVLSAC